MYSRTCLNGNLSKTETCLNGISPEPPLINCSLFVLCKTETCLTRKRKEKSAPVGYFYLSKTENFSINRPKFETKHLKHSLF